MQQMRKLGPMSKIFGMLPGMGQFKDQINSIDEKEIDRIEAIIYSMTPAERADVSILNGSRRARIAKGSGVTVTDVNSLVNRFVEARKMMQSMAGSIPGMPGGGARRPKQQAKKKKKQGNPARLAARNQARSQPPAQPGAAFGLPADDGDVQGAMKDFQLPPELQDMFKKQGKSPFGG